MTFVVGGGKGEGIVRGSVLASVLSELLSTLGNIKDFFTAFFKDILYCVR